MKAAHRHSVDGSLGVVAALRLAQGFVSLWRHVNLHKAAAPLHFRRVSKFRQQCVAVQTWHSVLCCCHPPWPYHEPSPGDSQWRLKAGDALSMSEYLVRECQQQCLSLMYLCRCISVGATKTARWRTGIGCQALHTKTTPQAACLPGILAILVAPDRSSSSRHDAFIYAQGLAQLFASPWEACKGDAVRQGQCY